MVKLKKKNPNSSNKKEDPVIRAFALENYEKPEPGEAIIVEIDELWHFIESKSGDNPRGTWRINFWGNPRRQPLRKTQGNAHQEETNYGSGKLMSVTMADLSTGNWETVIVKPSKDY